MKLAELPKEGRVVLVHPSDEAAYLRLGREEDYVLDRYTPPGSFFFMDMDALPFIAPESWERCSAPMCEHPAPPSNFGGMCDECLRDLLGGL